MANASTCLPCNEKNLVWTFVWQNQVYQSTDHSKISAKRRTLGANTARLARRPKMPSAHQV